jgi:hypothetical protein
LVLACFDKSAALLLGSHCQLVLLEGSHLLAKTLLLGLLHLPCSDGRKERLEVVVEILFSDPQVPLEEAEELLLHEVDLSEAEAEVVKASNGGVSCPVLVLG